jgi:hypothetical protein
MGNEKFKDGETLAEYREKRRSRRSSAKLSVKVELKVRDGIGCRWPGCEFWRKGYIVDGAHVMQAAGSGGDPRMVRSQRHHQMRICRQHHRGPVSLHSGDLRVIPLTDKGTDGPCEFQARNPKAENGWEVVGGEDDFTFARRRNESAAEDSDED